jgi:DNA repair exonuclease SbcCD nuclease subunit
MTRILFISDIHFKHSNVQETDIMIKKLKEINDYDFAVLAGDILDTHERVDVQLLNRAYHMIDVLLQNKKHVFICVGNHDMINNQQFLTTNHWMNGIKKWPNVTVVDVKPVMHHDGFIFLPYVYPGRLREVLDMQPDWKSAKCIFAHQEIRGCKMGPFVSKDGDEWELDMPLIISGHIHERQRPQPNVFYPGSVITHAYGKQQSEDQGLSIFTFHENEPHEEERISLGLKSKKTIYVNVDGDLKLEENSNSHTRIVVSGTIDEILAHKKIHEKSNVKIQYNIIVEPNHQKTDVKLSFVEVLSNLVEKTEDSLLKNDFNSLMKYI